MNRNWIGYWLCAVGITAHIVFWLLLGTLARNYTDKVWDRMWHDPEFTVGYEQWEVDWNYTLMAMLSVPFVYLPAAIVALVAALLPSSRRRRKMIALQVFCISLGILSLLYTILCATSKA